MSVEPAPLLLAALSARALGESAVRGGFAVTLFDSFGDCDSRRLGPWIGVRGDACLFDPDRLRRALRAHAAGAARRPGLVYGAGLEAAPWVADCCEILGNDAEVLRLAGDPGRFFGLLDRLRIDYPPVRLQPPADASGWLLKNAASSGGRAVIHWRPGSMAPPTAAGTYYQRRVEGPVLSALFVADGDRHRTIGCNRLAVESGSDGRAWVYAGAVNRAGLAPGTRRELESVLARLTAALGLRGVNGVDFVLDGDRPLLLELNPRPTATLELYEDRVAGGWLARHVEACRGRLPATVEDPKVSWPVRGHAVVYAGEPMRVPADFDWPRWCRDLPAPSTPIGVGEPVCSVFACGASTAAVRSSLARRRRVLLGQFVDTAKPGDSHR